MFCPRSIVWLGDCCCCCCCCCCRRQEGEVAKARSTIQKKHEEKKKPGKSGIGDKIVSAVKNIIPGLKKKEKKVKLRG